MLASSGHSRTGTEADKGNGMDGRITRDDISDYLIHRKPRESSA